MTVTTHAPHVAPLNHLADLAVATHGGEPYYHADHGGGIHARVVLIDSKWASTSSQALTAHSANDEVFEPGAIIWIPLRSTTESPVDLKTVARKLEGMDSVAVVILAGKGVAKDFEPLRNSHLMRDVLVIETEPTGTRGLGGTGQLATMAQRRAKFVADLTEARDYAYPFGFD